MISSKKMIRSQNDIEKKDDEGEVMKPLRI